MVSASSWEGTSSLTGRSRQQADQIVVQCHSAGQWGQPVNRKDWADMNWPLQVQKGQMLVIARGSPARASPSHPKWKAADRSARLQSWAVGGGGGVHSQAPRVPLRGRELEVTSRMSQPDGDRLSFDKESSPKRQGLNLGKGPSQSLRSLCEPGERTVGSRAGWTSCRG